jgi:hypothetical protein
LIGVFQMRIGCIGLMQRIAAWRLLIDSSLIRSTWGFVARRLRMRISLFQQPVSSYKTAADNILTTFKD